MPDLRSNIAIQLAYSDNCARSPRDELPTLTKTGPRDDHTTISWVLATELAIFAPWPRHFASGIHASWEFPYGHYSSCVFRIILEMPDLAKHNETATPDARPRKSPAVLQDLATSNVLPREDSKSFETSCSEVDLLRTERRNLWLIASCQIPHIASASNLLAIGVTNKVSKVRFIAAHDSIHRHVPGSDCRRDMAHAYNINVPCDKRLQSRIV